jgi:Cu(I)/Ag(I) efflux system membrane fusion protein/cobalt-zinc-cadmium efflux system membrane fusion protein
MGMDLVPVYEDEGGASGVVTIDGAVQQSMNVKIATVGIEKLSNKISTNGVLSTDERNEYIVTTKVNGWIEKLYVNYTGQVVKKGQKLVDIYSPELVAAQQELLTAIEYKQATGNTDDNDILKSGDELINNTIRKLELLDISEADIQKLINTKKINKYMTLYAPMNGTVLMKYVIEGEKIMAGKQLMHIADLSRLWLKADIYESELAKVKLGSKVKINFSYLPAKTYEGKVTFIYPTVDPKTRIIQLRIDVQNMKDELKPAMFANVEIEGKPYEEMPVISETSVIRSGKKNIVILALGEGKFKPIEVKLGGYSDGYYQVVNGLSSGDKIVTSAQFMIDSESSLRAAVSLYSSDKGESKKDEMSAMGHNHSDNNIEEQEQEHKHSEMEEMEMLDEKHNHGGMESEGIIRKGIIDLSVIDKNKDGKVFQDMMDWNVISDEEGRCPICEMKLREVTLEEAKENLLKNGFKVKQ